MKIVVACALALACSATALAQGATKAATSAVVTYTWTGKGTYMGQPMPEKTYASTVWTQRNGKWVAVFHQESVAVEPPAPAKKK